MASAADSVDDAARQDTVLPVGRVATLLGIPAVTLRSWEARYGLQPSSRTSGLHRRYTSADVDRLRRMQRLMTTGVSARDAARLSARPDASDLVSTDATWGGGQILRAAEGMALGKLGELLDDCLSALGATHAWTEHIAPALRALESRYEHHHDCTDIELILARSVGAAVERYVARRKLWSGGSEPVLLVHCPQERHTLPLTMLMTVLLERSQPVVLLGPDTTEAAILQSISRASPHAVVLWATVRRAGQLRIRDLAAATGFPTLTAGPGWPPSTHPLADLATAADALTTRRSSSAGVTLPV